MVSQIPEDGKHRVQRRMLTPSVGRVPARGQQRGVGAPISVLFAGMLFVGLASIAVAVWFTFFAVLRPAESEGTASGARALLHAELTRDAQQVELVRMRDELDRVSQELAAARATPTELPPTEVPQLASPGWTTPPLALILDAPVYKQQRSLSCESSAAAMAANYYGVTIGEQDILAALPHHENPHLGFRGNVDGPHGGTDDYGVYAEPVHQVLAEWGLDVERLVGGTEEIRETIRRGRLVIAWITYDLQAQLPRRVTLGNGQVVTLVPYEHTVLVVGYNRNGLWVNDPYSGTQAFYPEADFIRSFSYLNNMALVIGPPAS